MSTIAPRVSVVIPTFDAAATIETALASVAVQDFDGLEVIVVDDASRDDTVERAALALKAAGLPHQVLRQEQNGGPARARNRGVAEARGDYIAFLDADDEWLPGKVTRQVAVLDADPTITLCGCQAVWVDAEGNEIEPLFEDLPERIADGWKRLLWECYVATPCAMVRREDLGARPFDPTLRVGEDRDLWIKLASNGAVGLVQEVMVRIRLSPESFMPRNTDALLTCTRPMIERHIRDLGEHLSLRHRLLARGSLNSQIGKSISGVRNRYAESVGYLLRSVLLGYRPVDGLRELVYRAPVLRDVKPHVKRLMGRA
jgi:glycosyltransferase involved in cell wall biosynthesis